MTSTHDSLQEEIRKGGQVQAAEDALAGAAGALGYAVFPVDCARAKSKSAVLRAIATAVDFPEFFGGNLDALLDCLTATVLDQPGPGALLLLKDINGGEPALAEHLEDIMTTFADAAEYVRDNGKVLAYARL
ncbi:barstar family protein [Verticiella sediminum]|nr:barstar family protein [Verticiella sediminum]